MESKIEGEENLLDHEFDVNLLPVEIRIEIFSYLKHNERLKAALVCTRWFKIARDHQFDLSLKKMTGLDEFINIFNEGSMSLPVQCIEFKIFRNDEAQVPQIKLNQINDIVKQYGHVKIVAKVYEDTAEHFLQLIKILPEKFKNIIWNFDSPSDFQKYWLDICNAVQSKKIEVVIHGELYWDSSLKKEILSTLINETPVNNFCIEKLLVDSMIFKEFEQKKLVEFLSSLKFAGLIAREPEDFIFLNQFLSPSATHFTLLSNYDNDYNTGNFLELLPNLTNVQQIKIDIRNSSIPLSFTSTTLNFPKLKKFEFTTYNIVLEYESFKRFVESSPNLEEIIIYILDYSKEQALMLIEKICLFCPFLKKLSFVDHSHNGRGNTQSLYFRAFKNLQNLESLLTPDCEFQLNVLNGLQLNALKELDISFISMDPEGARKLMKAFPNLEKLTLIRPNYTANKYYFEDIKDFDTNTVKVLSEFQNLKYIKLLFCPEDSTEEFTNILKEKNPDLEVHIAEC